MSNKTKLVPAMAMGLLAGATLAYVVAPSGALALLAVVAAVVAGAFFGLFSDALFHEKAGLAMDLKETEGPTAESRDFLQTVIDGIPDVTIVVSRDHRIVLANRAARELVGGEDPVSRCLTCHQVSHHSDVPCERLAVACPLEQVVETRNPVEAIHTHYDSDDNEILVKVHATPIFDDMGEVVEMIEACRNITESKDAGVSLLST